MSVLLLCLAGPLQSWGAASRFSRRETERHPTKSGVIGLLAAAQGRRRTDSVEDLLGLDFGVRIDQPGSIIADFQTARRLNGKSMPLTRRFYLSDAVFVAGVGGDDALIDGLESALRTPRFPLYLGRRSCPPSRPLPLGRHDGDVDAALRTIDWQAADWHRRTIRSRDVALRIIRDAHPGETGATLRDVPLSFDPQRREYGWRTVVEAEPHPVANEHGRDDPHDPFAALGG